MAGNLDKDYESAGFSGHLGFGAKPALILVDFVEAYFDKASPLYAGVEDSLASAIRSLLNTSQQPLSSLNNLRGRGW